MSMYSSLVADGCFKMKRFWSALILQAVQGGVAYGAAYSFQLYALILRWGSR